MDKQIVLKTAKKFCASIRKYSPEILTGLGIAGMITTTILAVRATPKALILINEKKEKQDSEKIPTTDIIKLTWKCYLPSVIIGGISIGCLIGASSSNLKRNAALATAYSISESALKEYQGKVIETIGEKKEQEIKDDIAKDRIAKNPVANREVIITERGNTLCLDLLSGRYFKSDIDKLHKVENELNRRMIYDMYVSLNDFYYELGLDGVLLGEDLGWNINTGEISLDFSSQLTSDSTPCLVINYRVTPKYGYTDY